MSTQPGNAFVGQSIALHQIFWNTANPNAPSFLTKILWVEAVLEPIAAVLYIISAIPAVRKEGFWFFAVESNGTIRPNNSLLIPIFVLLYVICSLSSLICLLIDMDSATVISARTVFLSLLSYPILLFTGWTKVWNVLRTIPLTKYGLATMRQTNGDSSLKFFAPRTINCISAFLYGFPLLFGSVPIGLITEEVWKINQTFTAYNHGYSSIISGTMDSESISNLNIIAVKQLMTMLHSSDRVLFLARLISVGYFFNGLVLLFVMIFGYYRLLKAVAYQIETFQKALELCGSTTSCVRILKSPCKFESTPNSPGGDLAPADSVQAHVKECNKRSWVVMHLPAWLPSFRRDAEFFDKSAADSALNHHTGVEGRRWESLNQETIYSQRKALERYKVNLLWQVSCNGLISLSFLGLNVTIFSNLLQVPHRHSLSALIWLTITWASVSWVLTVGIPFGLVACVVAFSPPITSLRENEERVVEFDE